MTLRRRIWTILLITAMAVTFAVYRLSVATPLYTSDAVVALDSRKTNVVDLDSVVAGVQSDFSSVQLQAKIIGSRTLFERVVKALDLTNDPEFNPSLAASDDVGIVRKVIGSVRLAIAALLPAPASDAPASPSPEEAARQTMITAVDILAAKVKVVTDDWAPVFTISVQTQSAAKSALIANTVAEKYILDQLESKFAATEQATLWLSDRVAELKVRLETSEARLADYTAGSSVLSEEALEAENRQIKELRDRVARGRAQLDGLSGNRAEIEALLASGQAVEAARLIQDPSQALASRLQRIANLARPYPAEHVEPIAALVQLELDRAAQRADEAAQNLPLLERTIADLEARREAKSADLIRLRELERETEATRTLYEYFLQRMNEISVQQGLQEADARVLSSAVVRSAPTSPNKMATLLLAIVGGGVFAVLYALTSEFLTTRIRTRDDIARITGIPVIAEVPLASARGRKRLVNSLTQQPGSRFAEAIGNLHATLMLSNVDSPPQVVMFNSAVPGDGKSSLSVSFAIMAARTKRKAILIECDLRRPVMKEFFGDPAQKDGATHGLISYLGGEAQLEDAIHHDAQSGIDVMFAERTRNYTMDVFSSEAFARLISELRNYYDFIILDTPPVLVVPDARVIASHADATVFAIRWNVSTREVLRSALQLYNHADLSVTGIVMNQINPKKLARYGYGYYSYRSIDKYYGVR
ncbi:polysaccharide biosynthesis tyrosine autokinase [Limibaculum sp. M0105]|uniref:non-specific protein-tyrosine kinase n=2 Tax=Thermohalobaculum xanthum TaxID=2753746 RepID=A0A8J7M5N7_9RHOB|nr:polysaccharide biosynthesis tyrosine autokinase [Thermohalobaculum xanthum]